MRRGHTGMGATLLCLLLAACTTGDGASPSANGTSDQIASEDTTELVEPSLSSAPSPTRKLELTDSCDGLGRPRSSGEVTFLEKGRLLAVSPDGERRRCLADLSEDRAFLRYFPMSWNGPADRVLVGDHAFSGDLGAAFLGGRGFGAPQWSRPNGTSVVGITRDGRLMKRSSLGGSPSDISFLARHDDVVYHPAGEHIATSGLAEDGSYGLYLATNVGTEEQLLARGEAARFITDLGFSPNGRELYYSARHGPKSWHLHRLIIGEDAQLETLDKNERGFDFSISEVDDFPPFTWSARGDCAAGKADRLHLTPGDGFEIPEQLKRTSLRPVGWLRDRTLVVASRPISCSTAAPEDIYVLHRSREPVLVADDTYGSAAVRVTLPPPPPPPGEEQEVVA